MQLKKIHLLVKNKIEDFLLLKQHHEELCKEVDSLYKDNKALQEKIENLESVVLQERKIANENVLIYNKKFEQLTGDMSIMVTALKELYIFAEQNRVDMSSYYDTGWGSNEDDEEGH
jgi:hypothetical protein